MLRTILPVLAFCTVITVSAQDMILGVSEGTSGGADHLTMINKYRGLADIMARSVGRPVDVVYVREFAALEAGMKAGRFDFVFARPSDYPARGIESYGYTYLANAKPDGHCLLITRAGSPIKSIDQVRGKRIVLPQASAYMTKFCLAELRSRGIDPAREQVQYVREQGLVTMYLKNELADVGGIASYSGEAGKLESKGLTVVHTSVPQPYFPLIAARRVTQQQRDAIRKALGEVSLTSKGAPVLKSIGIDSFELTSERRLQDLLVWLGA